MSLSHDDVVVFDMRGGSNLTCGNVYVVVLCYPRLQTVDNQT